MSERDEALNSYLFDLRTRAALSLEEVCARTKIQPRYVKALEEGRYDAVPSNTHLRAFSQALAQACGGDKARVTLLVGRVLSAAAPVTAAPRSFDSKAPAPVAVAKPLPEAKPEAQAGGPSGAWVPASGPAMSISTAGIAPLVTASARLRNLPLPALLGLLGLAGSLSFGTAWALDQWKRHSALQALASASTAIEAVKEALPASAGGAVAAAAKAAPLADAAPVAPLPELELTLRARRDCWLVLQLDGQRQPTITMKDGDKFRYKFNDKAVLLAGNIGALRVWWRGSNLAYLGELGQRANAVVFERDKAPRFDAASALPLPTGVPE